MKKSMDQLFNKKPTESPSDIACRRLKELLLRGVLNPGQKLPYKELSELIGMSKTPIINALNQMVNEGFVEHELNRGYRIKEIDEADINYLLNIRLELERLNVKNAIKNCSNKDLDCLKRRVEMLSEYNPKFTDAKKLALDMNFHLEIAKIGKNTYSYIFLKTVLGHITFRYRFERGVDNRKTKIDTQHYQMVECISKGDEEGGLKCILDHINNLREMMNQYLESLRNSKNFLWD